MRYQQLRDDYVQREMAAELVEGHEITVEDRLADIGLTETQIAEVTITVLR